MKKAFLRFLLAAAVIMYLPGADFFRFSGKSGAAETVREETETGIGGGSVIPQETDLELTGIPLGEEYSLPHMLTFSSYTMEKGDMIGNIAARAGLTEDTLISVNDIKNTRLMQIGQRIRIPNQDGIFYSAKEGDTLEGIAETYKTTVPYLCTVNELFSQDLAAATRLFIPGARMDWVNRQEINGDLFLWPCAGYISSQYGYRRSPFNRTVRQFHSGMDIGAPRGTPVKAAMAGRVSQTGYNETFGNYVIISHHSGYRTMYGHMSVIRTKTGAYVGNNERIGDVGNTGLSTGPHLHFTVYKNGRTVNPRSLMK